MRHYLVSKGALKGHQPRTVAMGLAAAAAGLLALGNVVAFARGARDGLPLFWVDGFAGVCAVSAVFLTPILVAYRLRYGEFALAGISFLGWSIGLVQAFLAGLHPAFGAALPLLGAVLFGLAGVVQLPRFAERWGEVEDHGLSAEHAALLRDIQGWKPHPAVPLAKQAEAEGDYDSAAELWGAALAADPADPRPYRNVAQTLAALGKLNEGKEISRRGWDVWLAASPLQDLIERSEQDGDVEELLRLNRIWAALAPNEVAPRIRIGRMLLGEPEPGEGDRMLAEAAALRPRDVTILQLRAIRAGRLGRWQDATVWWSRLIKLDGKDVNARLQRALATANIEEYDLAENMVRQVEERWRDNPHLDVIKAQVAFRSFRWETALARWRLLRDREPARPGVDTQIALCLAFLGRFEEADDIVRRELARSPSLPSARWGAATVAQAAERWAVAVERWPGVLAQDGNSFIARGYYAIALANSGDLIEGRVQADKAHTIAPTHPFVIETRAEVEQLAGRYEEAVRLWRSSLSVGPSVRAQCGLAISLKASGMEAEAHQLFEQLQAKWPTHQLVLRALQAPSAAI